MKKIRALLTSLWLLVTPLAQQSGRLLSQFNSQAGNAKPGPVVATGTAAGLGVIAMALRGCRSAAHTGADDIGRGAIALVEDAGRATHIPLPSTSAIDELSAAASRPWRWESFSGVVSGTEAAKGLTKEQIALKWNNDPLFRARVFGEISQNSPGRLNPLYDDILSQPRLGFTVTPEEARAGLAATLESEPVILYDVSGRPISTSIAASAEAEYRKQALRVFDSVLRDMPQKRFKSEAELKDALTKALKNSDSARKADYSLDVGTGKLTLKLKTKHGEFKGDINAYRLVKRLAVGGAGALTLSELRELLSAEGETNKRPVQPAHNGEGSQK